MNNSMKVVDSKNIEAVYWECETLTFPIEQLYSDKTEITYSIGSICVAGIIKRMDGEYYIEWEDDEQNTLLDGSDFCNEILKNCTG